MCSRVRQGRYYFLSGEICELNNAGLKDPCNNADDRLIRSTGWIYYEIDALQVKNIQPFMQLSRVIARVVRRKIIFRILALFLFRKTR